MLKKETPRVKTECLQIKIKKRILHSLHCFHSLKTISIFSFFIFSTFISNGITITSNATGNWSAGGTWVGGIVPGPTDNVVIVSNHVITVNGIYTCANLTIGSNNSSCTARITAAANSLTITGLLTMNSANATGTYTLDAGPGTVNINGTISWTCLGGTNLIETTSTGTVNITPAIVISRANQNLKATVSGGTLRFHSDVTDQQNRISAVAGSNIYFSGSYTVNTTATTLLNATSNTYFTGTGKHLVSTVAVTFGNVYINAGAAITASGAGIITVAGSFQLNAGSTYTQTNDLYVKLNWTNNGGTLIGGTNHVYLTASNATARTINGTSATTFPNLHIGKPSGTWAVKYGLNATISCASLTFESNSSATSYVTHNGAYALNVNGNVTIKQLTANAGNSWNINTGSAAVSGNLIFSGTSNTVSRITQVVVTTGSFSLAGSVTYMANTATATEVISVTTGSLTFESSLQMAQGSGTLRVSSTGTVNFKGAAPSFSLNATSAGGSTAVLTTTAGCYLKFENGLTNANSALVIKNGSFSVFTGNSIVTPTTSITFGSVTIEPAGTLALAGNIVVTNNWLNNGGTFSPSTNTVTFTPLANVTQTIAKTGGEIFYNLTANLATAKLQLNTDVTVTNTLNMSGHTFNLNGNTLTLGSGSAATLTISGVTATKGFAYGGTFKRYLVAGAVVSGTSAPYNGLFPIGILNDYRPVRITSTAVPTGSGYISASHTDAITVTDVSYLDNQGVTITRVSDQVSALSNSGVTGGTYNIEATFNGFSNPGPASFADYRLITNTGSVLGSVGTYVLPTANTLLNPVVKRNGLTATDLSNDFICGTINSTHTPIQQVFYSRPAAPSPLNLNWNASGTWSTSSLTGASCGCTPTAAGYVVISTGTLVHVNTAVATDKIEIKTGGTLDGTANLTTNTFISTAGTGIIAPTSGTWSVGSNMTLSGTGSSTSGAIINVAGDLTINAGVTLTMNAALTVSDDIIVNSTLAMGTSTLTLNGASGDIGGTSSINGSGSILISNDKTIVPGSALTIAPTFAIANNTTVTNNSTITFSGDVTGGNSNSTWLNQPGSILNIAGTIMTTGKLNVSAIPNTVNYNSNGSQAIKTPVSSYYNLICSNGGTKTMSGSFSADNAVTIQGTAILDESTFVLDGNGDLLMTNGTPELKIQRNSNTTSPELTGDYTLSVGAITINQTANTNTLRDASYYNLKLTGSASYNLGNVDFINNDFTIAGSSVWTNTSGNNLIVRDSLIYSSTASSTLTGDINTAVFKLTAGTLADGGNIITLTSGDWIKNGGTYAATGKVIFNSTTAQNISGSSSSSFHDLTINNSSVTGVTLNNATTVNDTLTLIRGNINTTASNLLTLATTAVSGVGSATSYVNGPMAYVMSENGTSTLNFPIGKTGDWRPVTVTPTHTSITAYTYTAELFNSSANALNWTLPASINKVSDIHYWDINRSSSSTADLAGATIELYYNSSNGTSDQVTDHSNLTIAKAPVAGNSWTNIGGLASANSIGSIVSNSFNSFSRFTLANKSAGINPLPIELLSFDAISEDDVVNLKWSTATETNNDYFTIEKTKDGFVFEEVTRVKGAGNSTRILNYLSDDETPYSDVSYYRLKQTDHDGKYSYSELKKVNFQGELLASLNVYPIPNEGEVIHIDFLTEQDEQVTIEMRDLSGKRIYTIAMTIDKGNNTHTIYMSNKLSKGTYIITTTTAHGLNLLSKKLVVK
jgi:hypothetical protein